MTASRYAHASSSSATIANCVCYAAGSVGSSATSAAKITGRPELEADFEAPMRAVRRSDRTAAPACFAE